MYIGAELLPSLYYEAVESNANSLRVLVTVWGPPIRPCTSGGHCKNCKKPRIPRDARGAGEQHHPCSRAPRSASSAMRVRALTAKTAKSPNIGYTQAHIARRRIAGPFGSAPVGLASPATRFMPRPCSSPREDQVHPTGWFGRAVSGPRRRTARCWRGGERRSAQQRSRLRGRCRRGEEG
jgi:hypothetical protein